MSVSHPWTDGNIVAIAWHAVFNYRFVWNRLEDVDAGLALDQIEDLLRQIGRAGNPVGPEMPPQLPAGDAVRPQVARLLGLIERTRRAVASAFVGAEALPDQIWAACRFPRVYTTLPSAAMAPAEDVELLHLGDLPPRTIEWQQRARVAKHRSLQVLTLFNMQLGGHGIGIDLGALARLRCLDLRDNGFEAAPPDALKCAGLEWLHLAGNPLTALPDIESLPRLAFLGLGGTGIAEAAMAELRQRRPGLTVDASA